MPSTYWHIRERVRLKPQKKYWLCFPGIPAIKFRCFEKLQRVQVLLKMGKKSPKYTFYFHYTKWNICIENQMVWIGFKNTYPDGGTATASHPWRRSMGLSRILDRILRTHMHGFSFEKGNQNWVFWTSNIWPFRELLVRQARSDKPKAWSWIPQAVEILRSSLIQQVQLKYRLYQRRDVVLYFKTCLLCKRH